MDGEAESLRLHQNPETMKHWPMTTPWVDRRASENNIVAAHPMSPMLSCTRRFTRLYGILSSFSYCPSLAFVVCVETCKVVRL